MTPNCPDCRGAKVLHLCSLRSLVCGGLALVVAGLIGGCSRDNVDDAKVLSISFTCHLADGTEQTREVRDAETIKKILETIRGRRRILGPSVTMARYRGAIELHYETGVILTIGVMAHNILVYGHGESAQWYDITSTIEELLSLPGWETQTPWDAS